MDRPAEPSPSARRESATLLPSVSPDQASSPSLQAEDHQTNIKLDEASVASHEGKDLTSIGNTQQSTAQLTQSSNAQDSKTLNPTTPFKPLFTIIQDTTTGEQHHPHVRYIFSDDDPDTLTAGILQALASPQQQPTERHLIIDMSRDGKSITSAQSMTPDWQILENSIGPAPTFDEGTEPGENGAMLRICGVEAPSPADLDAPTADVMTSVESLARRFEEEMGMLRKVAGMELGEVLGEF